MDPNWFRTRKVRDDLYVTREVHFYEGNRANIWLVKGATKDVIIDTGRWSDLYCCLGSKFCFTLEPFHKQRVQLQCLYVKYSGT